jgi:hypothetical protein
MLDGLAEDVSTGAVGKLVIRPTASTFQSTLAQTTPIEIPQAQNNELF